MVFTLAVIASVIIFAIIVRLIYRTNAEETYIDVGKSTALLTMKDGIPRTITREGIIYESGYYTHSRHRIGYALDDKWVTMDDGTTYNRNQIISYRVETIEHKVKG